jgi:hypothetical protein
VGDISTLLSGLNLSPINTLLLIALILTLKYVINQFEKRIITLEKQVGKQGNSISWIKGHIDGDEPEDDDE